MNELVSATAAEIDLRRRNRRMGLWLGFAFVLIMAVFFVKFTIAGLPKDPAEFRRLKQKESADAPAKPVGSAANPSRLPPAPAQPPVPVPAPKE